MSFPMNRWSVVGGWVLASSIMTATLVALGLPLTLPVIALIAVCVIVPPVVVLMVWQDGLPATVTDILAAAQTHRP